MWSPILVLSSSVRVDIFGDLPVLAAVAFQQSASEVRAFVSCQTLKLCLPYDFPCSRDFQLTLNSLFSHLSSSSSWCGVHDNYDQTENVISNDEVAAFLAKIHIM